MGVSRYHYNNHFFKNPIPCGDFLLFQAGEMYCDSLVGAELHEQNCFEITYAVDGLGMATANGKSSNLEKHDCFISLNGDIHSVLSDKDSPLRFKFLAFNVLGNSNTEDYIKHICKYLSDDHRKVNIPSLNDRFLRIFDELENGLVFSNQAIAMEITGMLIDIIRAMENKTQKRYPIKINNDNLLVFSIVTHIDNNVASIKNLYELENDFNYSYNYMSAIFKKIMNISINDYFISAKMNHAKTLLEKGLSVTDISEKLNYSSVHTFSRSFKNYFGQNPIEYKKQNPL